MYTRCNIVSTKIFKAARRPREALGKIKAERLLTATNNFLVLVLVLVLLLPCLPCSRTIDHWQYLATPHALEPSSFLSRSFSTLQLSFSSVLIPQVLRSPSVTVTWRSPSQRPFGNAVTERFLYSLCKIVSYLYLEKQKMTRLSVRTTKRTADTAPRVKPATSKTQHCPVRTQSIFPTFRTRIKHSKHRFYRAAWNADAV